ncbi:universal stress protein [Streptomyces sp. MB22_4]|uniref:universal stress protein n=1 Tax=Streptomyces sp. MB22_4 TaxID=3383120 RepID=UPI00399FC8CF
MTDPITVGVDGSGRSLRALVWAAHETKLRRCPLRIVHVLPPLHSHATTGEGSAAASSSAPTGRRTPWPPSRAPSRRPRCGLALGPVSHHLLQCSQCPLAVVRPRG